jgi:uncharacterized protein YjbI with pentapeptide repeats
MIARRIFSLFIGSSFIAIAIVFFTALRLRPDDHGFATVGVTALMTIYLAVGFYLVASFLLRRIPSATTHWFSDPDLESHELWDEQLDGIISDVVFQSAAPTKERRRIVGAGSVQVARGTLGLEGQSTTRPERRKIHELVSKLRAINNPDTDLTLIDLGATDLSRADLSGADLSRADLSKARLRWADIRESDLRETVLRGADLAHADFRRSDLSGADFSDAILREGILRWVDLRGADLTGADLFGANLEKALLQGAICRRANLMLASLNDTFLDEADLSEADLRGTDLRGANLGQAKGLTQAQVDSTRGDAGTILPRGLARPGHWGQDHVSVRKG